MLMVMLLTSLMQQIVKPQTAPAYKRLPGPNEAQALALADLRTLPAFDRPFIRYLWIDDGNPLGFKVDSWACNIISRASTIVRPEPVLGAGNLLRCNLRAYAPRDKDLKEFVETWEELQFDPKFSRLYTKGTLASATQSNFKGRGFIIATQNVFVDTPPYQHEGQMVHGRWEQKRVSGLTDFELKDLKDVELIRVPSTNIQTYLALVQLTGSQAPVVSDSYFIARGLSQIQESGVWQQLYGGLYYRFAGIKKNAVKGATDEDVLFDEHLGIGDAKKGIGAAAFYERLRSDQRAAIFASKVRAEAPRRADFFRAPGGARLDRGSGIVVITHDLKNQNADVDNHPLMNLLNFQDDARELIFERPNGLHGYAAINGKGALTDEVPPDVANDNTIPKPYNQRLQPAISCISCHEADGSDGWKPMANDVATLTTYRRKHGKSGDVNIFGDTSRLKDSLSDTLDRLAGLYQGDPEPALHRGRDDYAAAVLKATGPWPDSKRGQADVVQIAATALMKKYDAYWHQSITPAYVLRDQGIEIDPKVAIETLDRILAPDPRAALPIIGVGYVIPADPRIEALRCGLNLNRVDYDLIRSFIEERIKQTERIKK